MDQPQADHHEPPSFVQDRPVFVQLLTILASATAGAVSCWLLSAGKLLPAGIGAVAGALFGGLSTGRTVRRWLLAGACIGVVVAWPDLAAIKGQQPLIALAKIAGGMTAGLVIGLIVEARSTREKRPLRLP